MSTLSKERPETEGAASVPGVRTSYESDLYSWAFQQADLLLSGKLSELDREHLAEELVGLGNEQYHRLRSALAVVLQHLLKWDYQSQMRSRSWVLSVREHRRRVSRSLEESPSLESRLVDAIRQGYEDALDRAADETGLPDDAFPSDCPYSWEEIMSRQLTWPPIKA